MQFGIDYIDVEPVDDAWDLLVHFISTDSGRRRNEKCPLLAVENITILAGTLETDSLTVDSVSYAQASDGIVIVSVSRTDDGSRGNESGAYFLRIDGVREIDPARARGKFFLDARFETDPEPAVESAPQRQPDLNIDYQAKDYASFLKELLDHLSLLAPGWKERHAADTGIAIVEVLAYAADYLSYYQDAVATEAYLGTARQRVSLRRHARLMDYAVNDGWNSRVWVQVQVDDEDVRLPEGTPLLTGLDDLNPVIPTEFYKDLSKDRAFSTFEVMLDAILYRAHNEMLLYGPASGVIGKGATSAALQGHYPKLKSGDVLIIAENGARESDGAQSGSRRFHPVRLIRIPVLTRDRGRNVDITSISWHDDDALPFSIRLSNIVETPGTTDWSVLGNIVLADSGRTVPPELLEAVPASGRYRPRLKFKYLTYSEPIDERRVRVQSAQRALQQSPWDIMPAIALFQSDTAGSRDVEAVLPSRASDVEDRVVWRPRRDLLRSGRFAREFVAETESDGHIYLRFGDGRSGARLAPGARFVARYRVSNHLFGGAPRGIIRHVVSDDGRIMRVWNPLAAPNEAEPDSIEQVRFNAATAYKTQFRCVTEDDYAQAAESHAEVRKAVCRLRWCGSRLVAFIHVDRLAGAPMSGAFLEELREVFQSRRLAGHDFEIVPPRLIPLDISLRVTLDRHHFAGTVRQNLHDAFSISSVSRETEGFFDPDRFTFGTPVYLSQIVATAMQIAGVTQVEPLRFQRWGSPARGEIDTGVIGMGPSEIALVSNDPEAPQKGTITFLLERGSA